MLSIVGRRDVDTYRIIVIVRPDKKKPATAGFFAIWMGRTFSRPSDYRVW